MSDSKNDFQLRVEALLFAYGEWLSPEQIAKILGSKEKRIVNELEILCEKYKSGFSFHLVKDEMGKWKMSLREEFEDLVEELVSDVEIPKSVLKVLSVIAYEQPISKTRLAEILGKSVKSEVDYLYKAKFVSYEKSGIGKYYRVTKKFFDYFKIEGDDFRETANKDLQTFLQDFESEKSDSTDKEER